jgi:hypothetical protein
MTRRSSLLLAVCLALSCGLLVVAACGSDPDDDPSARPDADVAFDGGADLAPDLAPDSAVEDLADAALDLPDETTEEPVPDADADADADSNADADAEGDGDDASDVGQDLPDLGDVDVDELCGPRDPIPATGPYLRAGYGFGAYREVANCELVPITYGIQGGAHLWGAFEAGGFEASADWFFTMDFEFLQNGEVVAEAHYADTLRRGGVPPDGPFQYDSVTVVIHDFDADGAELDPEDLLDIPGVLRVRLHREGVVDLLDEVVLIPHGTDF